MDISLVPLKYEYYDDLYKLVNCKKTQELYGHYSPVSYKDHCSYLDNLSSDQNRLFFVIIDEDFEFCGQIQLNDIDWVNRTANLQIAINENKRGKNIGYLSILKIHAIALFNHNLRLINLHVKSFNDNAIGLYTKIGYKEIGRIKDYYIIGDQMFDKIYMTINLETTNE